MESTFSFGFSEILSYVGIGVFILVALYSLFLVYHWFAYGTNPIVNILATVIYLSGTGFFLLLMAGGIATP